MSDHTQGYHLGGTRSTKPYGPEDTEPARDITNWAHVPPEPTTGWLPIETAPKDGTRVLVWAAPSRRVIIGAFDGSNRVRAPWRHRAIGGPSIWPRPTHWRPLPTPPTA